MKSIRKPAGTETTVKASAAVKPNRQSISDISAIPFNIHIAVPASMKLSVRDFNVIQADGMVTVQIRPGGGENETQGAPVKKIPNPPPPPIFPDFDILKKIKIKVTMSGK